MIKCVICDDEATETEYLSDLVNQWAAENKQTVSITCYPSAEAFLFAYEDAQDINVLLLDIQMGQMDGVALAKAVRKKDKTVQIIFITSYMEYIADGYDVEALHYLIKPASQEKLSTVLNRALDKLAHTERNLYVQHGGVNVKLPLHHIRYLEVMHNHVTIYSQEVFRVKKTLSELEKDLDENFFRIGRSFIVNLQYVRKVSRDTVWLEGGATVPLSRGLYDKINRAIIAN